VRFQASDFDGLYLGLQVLQTSDPL